MATMSSEEYYKNLKDESYKTMLDSEIQASIARDQAMKYTMNQVGASGYANQGLAQSSMLGVQNNYRNALRDAQAQYESSLNNINEQQRQEAINQENTDYTKDDNNFKTVSTLMSGATTQEQLNKIYDEYKNDESLSANSKKQLGLLYSMYSDSFAQAETPNTAQLSLDDKSATAVNKDGKVENVDLQAKFSAETRTLRNAINTGTLPNDSYIKLENLDGLRLYARYYNGALYYVNENEYKKHIEKDTEKKTSFTIKGYDNIDKA